MLSPKMVEMSLGKLRKRSDKVSKKDIKMERSDKELTVRQGIETKGARVEKKRGTLLLI